MSDLAHLQRIVSQHAMTSKLLGVDFVPIGRGGGRAANGGDAGTASRIAAAVATAPRTVLAPVAPVPASREPVSAQAVIVTETKPMPPPLFPRSADTAKAPRPAPAPSSPLNFGGGGQVGGGETFTPLRKHAPDRAAALLEQLRARYEADRPHKHFVTSFNKIVFGEGDPAARLMFIGEAPGADEDRTGRPFVGRAGQLLEKMINAMGLKREQVYIANVLKTRPPNNATPTLEEAAMCAPYLYEQIGIIRPEAIVALGLPAARTLLNTTEAMARLRGRWSSFTPPSRSLLEPDNAELGHSGGSAIPVMPTYHPAFLLRSYTKENREKVWADLKMVIDRLGIKQAGKAVAGAAGRMDVEVLEDAAEQVADGVE